MDNKTQYRQQTLKVFHFWWGKLEGQHISYPQNLADISHKYSL